jgi:uncharacterized protein YcbK (DUF882 family)
MGVSSILAGPVRPSRASAATYPPGELALYNTHTAERLAVTYRDRAGRYDPQALGALDRLLRCHATGKVIAMDVRVIEFLNLVEKRLGGGLEIHVISGFRAPEYNARLVRAGRGVAERSLHTVGRAIDVRLPAVDLRAVWRTAVRLERGGVGYYPRSGFVHLDSGRFRRW